jgi:acetylornithine/succinyldiaminopimelate/putrescine aminotransferase
VIGVAALIIGALMIGAAGGYALARRRADRGYRQLAALLLGLRDGDYTLRAIAARGALGAAFAAVNALADALMGTRRAGIESDALLGKLLGAVDLAADGTPGKRGFAILRKAFEHGLVLRVTGDTVIFAPMFITTEDQLDEMFDGLRTVLKTV